MVYGRYNELVHGDYFMVYKPTYITGGPHPVPSGKRLHFTMEHHHAILLGKLNYFDWAIFHRKL